VRAVRARRKPQSGRCQHGRRPWRRAGSAAAALPAPARPRAGASEEAGGEPGGAGAAAHWAARRASGARRPAAPRRWPGSRPRRRPRAAAAPPAAAPAPRPAAAPAGRRAGVARGSAGGALGSASQAALHRGSCRAPAERACRGGAHANNPCSLACPRGDVDQSALVTHTTTSLGCWRRLSEHTYLSIHCACACTTSIFIGYSQSDLHAWAALYKDTMSDQRRRGVSEEGSPRPRR